MLYVGLLILLAAYVIRRRMKGEQNYRRVDGLEERLSDFEENIHKLVHAHTGDSHD